MGGYRLKAPREWNGGKRQGLLWAREESDQGLAIWLELEDKQAGRLPPNGVAQTNRVTGTCRQTAPNSNTWDTNLWSQTWTNGDIATPVNRTPQPPGQSDRGYCYRRVSTHSPQADQEGGSKGHLGKLG